MLTDVLLVIRNNKGMREENFVSTIDEVLANIFQHETKLNKENNREQLNQYLDCLKQGIEGAEPFKWDGCYYAYGNDSYDMRLCQGPQDLLRFLSGNYNDSIKKMEARNPGSAGLYNSWSWENDSDRFSMSAIKLINEHAQKDKGFKVALKETMPDFPFDRAPAQMRHARLDDVIMNAEKNKAARTFPSKTSFQIER